MARNPLISIVVPVYAAAPSLRRCLDSLAGQTLEDIEVIVVDDASPDESPEIIEAYAKNDSRFRCVFNTRRHNAYDARRKGFALAKGDFLAACDADDRLPADGLAHLHAAASRTGADIVHGRARLLIDGAPKGVFHLCEPFSVADGSAYIRSFANFRRGWSIWGKLYRRSLWEKAAPRLPENMNWFSGDDLLYSYMFARHAAKYAPVREIVYHYSPPRTDYFHSTERGVDEIRGQLEILSHILTMEETSPGGDGNAEAIEALCAYIIGTILRNNGVSPHSPNATANLLEETRIDASGRLRKILTNGNHGGAFAGIRLLANGGGGEAYIAARRLLASLKFRGLRKTCGRLFS